MAPRLYYVDDDAAALRRAGFTMSEIAELLACSCATVRARLREQGLTNASGRPPLMPVEIRERILAEAAAGKSAEKIADGLDADGVPTVHGGRRWWPATVRKVLARAA
jgi:predicted transcriptional regulator